MNKAITSDHYGVQLFNLMILWIYHIGQEFHYDISNPDQPQSAQVAWRIYQLLLTESPSVNNRFAGELNEVVTNVLFALSPRKMQLAIETALGSAALAKRNSLMVQDFGIVQKGEKTKIGFL